MDRIDPAAAQSAIERLYAELSLNPPNYFQTVASPDQALRTFDHWKDITGRYLNVLWDYQLALCDPQGFWRQYGPEIDEIHFASWRKRNFAGAYALLDDNSPKATRILGRKLHRELWEAFDAPELDWCWQVLDLLDRYSAVVDHWDDVLFYEDPTCQANAYQFILLGPFDWLYQEVACVDFCYSELNIPRNDALYIPLEELLKSGSLVFTFENLCILCDRPIAIGPTIEFSDGSTVE